MTVIIPKTERTELAKICKRLDFDPANFVRVPTRPKFWVGEEDIEPKQAAYLLKVFNTKNRKPKKRSILKYAGDMKVDLWNERTHEAIAFSWSPCKLKDGQNRLMAICESGKTTKLLVCIGVNDKAAAAIDTGAGRNPQDAAIFLGQEGVTPQKTAAIRSCECGTGNQILSNQQTLALYEVYEEGLLFLETHLPLVGGITSLASVKGVILRAHTWYADSSNAQKNLARLALFCKILGDGQYGKAENRVAMQLRDRLNSQDMKGKSYGQTGRKFVYLLTEAAIVKFMGFKHVIQLKNVATEQFPFESET